MSIADQETVVRALHAPFWDENLRRGTKSAFQQPNISVSREAILPYDRIVEIFVHDLNRAAQADVPGRVVRGTATLPVGAVLATCAPARPKQNVSFLAAPESGGNGRLKNDAHALMRVRDEKAAPRKLSDAVAFAVLKLATIQEVAKAATTGSERTE